MALVYLLVPQRWNSDYAEWQAYYYYYYYYYYLLFYGYDSWRQISVYNDRFVLIRKLQTNNATVEIRQRTKSGTPALSLMVGTLP